MGNHRVAEPLKIALALSGGAGRGAFHTGVLQAIEDEGFEVAVLSGNSIGAIIACSFASGVRPKEILNILSSKGVKKAIRFNFLRKSLFYINENSPLFSQLFNGYQSLEKLPIPVTVYATNLNSGEYTGLDKGDLISSCIASASAWPILKPTSIDNELYIDGGYMNNLPIESLLQSKLPIIAVDLHPKTQTTIKSFFAILKRLIFLSWQSSVIKQKEFCTLYIGDERIRKISMFSFKDSQKAFNLGYELATEKLQSYKSSLCLKNI